MLWTIAVVLGLLWLLGIATSHTMGGMIHILFLAMVIMMAIRLLQGRRLGAR